MRIKLEITRIERAPGEGGVASGCDLKIHGTDRELRDNAVPFNDLSVGDTLKADEIDGVFVKWRRIQS